MQKNKIRKRVSGFTNERTEELRILADSCCCKVNRVRMRGSRKSYAAGLWVSVESMQLASNQGKSGKRYLEMQHNNKL